jgi:hypothetical protein
MVHWIISHRRRGKKTNDIKLATVLVNSLDHNLCSIKISTASEQVVRLSKGKMNCKTSDI